VSPHQEVLQEILGMIERAGVRLRYTHEQIIGHLPLSPESFESLDEGTRERLDAYAVRYARCQDLLYPAMRALGRGLLEPRADGPFLQLFALMQKHGIVQSTVDWERQRSLRNAVGHEYPDAEEIVDILNGIATEVPKILGYIERLKVRASAMLGDAAPHE
jgi:hypothetical protein